jgi:hypothetical protein
MLDTLGNVDRVLGLPVELDSLGFRPFIPAMFTNAKVLELDDLLQTVD